MTRKRKYIRILSIPKLKSKLNDLKKTFSYEANFFVVGGALF